MRLENEVRKRIDSIENKSPLTQSVQGIFPTKGGDGGDDILWLGLLSSVGIYKASLGILESQAQAGRTGMFYRNPQRRSTDNIGHSHFFSRDMAHGPLLLFCQKQPYLQSNAQKWLNYIDKNRPCVRKKPKWMGGGCWLRGLHRYAPDSRSDITPTMWAIMGRVWAANDWPLHSEMKRWKGADGEMSVIEASQASLGYQVHLKAVQAYIKLVLGQSREYRQKVADICHRRQPDNLFYEFLSRGNASPSMLKKFLEICPDPENFTPSDKWCWERSTMDFSKCCGWDMVFMGKLLLKFY